MKHLFLVLAVIVAAGCTNASNTPAAPIICAVEKPAEASVAAAIQSATGCPNLAAIEASVVSEVSNLKLNFCPTVSGAKTSIIGDTICGPLVNGLVSGVLAKAPADWGTCTGGPIVASAQATILAACQKAL